MLRLLLIVTPAPGQRDAVRALLSEMAPAAGYVSQHPEADLSWGAVEPRLDDPSSALALVESLEAAGDSTVALVASAEIVRAIVARALGTPVPAERVRFDPGTLAEVEVRADAPWTVNRLNDGCHFGSGMPEGARFVLT